MRNFLQTRIAASTAIILLAGGCASLGGNVKGDFACRAPEGTCAPTSMIDADATGLNSLSEPAEFAARSVLTPSLRTLQIVIAAYRDASGREHEARVVRVVLPDAPSDSWRAPTKRREVLRAIGNSLSSAHENPSRSSNDLVPTSPHLSEQLFIPSQPASAEPGAKTPVPGVSDRNASPGRASHPFSDDHANISPDQGDRR